MNALPAERSITLREGRCAILAAAVLWSLGGVVTKSLDLDGAPIAFYRGLFAGLVLLPFVPRAHWRFHRALVPLGLVFGAMTGLYIGSVKATTAANAIYLQYTSVFWTVPFSALFLGERPDRRALVGIALAMTGIGLILAFGYDGRPNEWRGIALGLGSGVGYAAVTTGLRGLRVLDSLWLSAILNLGGALALGLWIVVGTGGIPVPSRSQTLLLLAFGVLQMALPYALFARGLRAVRAPEAGLIALLEPILGPLWVFLVVGERPTRPTLVGGLLLLSGVACRYWPIRRPGVEPAVSTWNIPPSDVEPSP